jgi:hypothetical protein
MVILTPDDRLFNDRFPGAFEAYFPSEFSGSVFET